MASWEMVERAFRTIQDELNNPPITLLTPSRFEDVLGEALGTCDGKMIPEFNYVTARPNRPMEEIKNTLWHEVGHCLFPQKPHWWIECFAAKLARTPRRTLPHFMQTEAGQERRGVAAGRYSASYCHDLGELPGRSSLVATARLRVDHDEGLWARGGLPLNKDCPIGAL